MDENNLPQLNLTDSVQVGHNAIGPSTGDIVINAGTDVEHCSMCKTPIDAVSNPGLYCFKEGCNTLFCSNCESFFRASRKPGEKPYCSEHIAEFLSAGNETKPETADVQSSAAPTVQPKPTQPQPTQPQPTQPQPTQAQPVRAMSPPVPTVVGVLPQPVQSARRTQPMQTQSFVPFQQSSPRQVVQQMVGNPYLHQTMVNPWTAVVRTFNSWNGQGRAQRSEYWLGGLLYQSLLVFAFFGLTVPFLFAGPGVAVSIWFAIVVVAVVVFMIPLLSLQIRRLHDIGASGWWILLAVFLPYIGPIVLLFLAVLPSQPHPNKYDHY